MRKRLYVENWAPHYGSPFEADDEVTPATAEVQLDVEAPADQWEPRRGVDGGVESLAFIDGVRRIDARVTIDDPELGPVPGICVSLAYGAVVWDARARRSEIVAARVQRLAIFAHGQRVTVPPAGPRIKYRTESVPSPDPAHLTTLMQTRMRQAEGELGRELAQQGHLVIADGPIHPLEPATVVGYIKSQRAAYLPPSQVPVVAALRAGERTPLFVFSSGGSFARYSWYMRLEDIEHGHTWSGVARCECTGAFATEDASLLADHTTFLLPRFASAAHIEARAPQNLVPVAALERHLRRLLGDQGLVYRALCSAVARAA